MIPSSGIIAANTDERMPTSAAALWLAASSAALGGLLFGYDWVVIGGAKPFYERYFHLETPAIEGWAMSCAMIGCLFGAMASGALAERFSSVSTRSEL